MKPVLIYGMKSQFDPLTWRILGEINEKIGRYLF